MPDLQPAAIITRYRVHLTQIQNPAYLTSGNYLIDNSRLIQEFGLQYLPYRQRVLQIINDTRREAGLPPVADR